MEGMRLSSFISAWNSTHPAFEHGTAVWGTMPWVCRTRTARVGEFHAQTHMTCKWFVYSILLYHVGLRREDTMVWNSSIVCTFNSAIGILSVWTNYYNILRCFSEFVLFCLQFFASHSFQFSAVCVDVLVLPSFCEKTSTTKATLGKTKIPDWSYRSIQFVDVITNKHSNKHQDDRTLHSL